MFPELPTTTAKTAVFCARHGHRLGPIPSPSIIFSLHGFYRYITPRLHHRFKAYLLKSTALELLVTRCELRILASLALE